MQNIQLINYEGDKRHKVDRYTALTRQPYSNDANTLVKTVNCALLWLYHHHIRRVGIATGVQISNYFG